MHCYCEEPEIYRATLVKASRRKATCKECRRRMPVSSSYIRTFIVYEGDASWHITCLACDSLTTWVRAHVPCFCPYVGGLHDSAIETCTDYAKEADCPQLLEELLAFLASIEVVAKASRV